MVYLRATQKVLRFLPPRSPETHPTDTALGDWFVNRLVVDSQPLLLLVSGLSLLSILEPARNVRSLPNRLPDIVKRRLERMSISAHLVEREIKAMNEVLVAGTNDRSVLGTMVDFTRNIPFYFPGAIREGVDVLRYTEDRLAEIPLRFAGRDGLFPEREALALLADRWGGKADRA